MSVVIETTLGDVTVDLFLKERPAACFNFLKLCKIKYYNYNLFHTISRGFIAQTGDPTGTRKGGESIHGVISGPLKRYVQAESNPRIKHTRMGLISFVCNEDFMMGSQFFFTLGDELTYLDEKHCVFGEVVEGVDVLEQINEAICCPEERPYQDIRITHTVILDDPLPDPPKLGVPSRSPSPSAERLQCGRIPADEEIDETAGKSIEEMNELIAEREAKARATILEMVGDIPDAEMAPPENVLFVCKLNPVTTDDDLEIIFSRFGKIKTCEVIRDHKSGDSLQYAFIEFEEQKSCEEAYFKMDNVLIDDRRIHVDFSQSVSKVKWHGKGRGVTHYDDKGNKTRKSDMRLNEYKKSTENGNGHKNERSYNKRRTKMSPSNDCYAGDVRNRSKSPDRIKKRTSSSNYKGRRERTSSPSKYNEKRSNRKTSRSPSTSSLQTKKHKEYSKSPHHVKRTRDNRQTSRSPSGSRHNKHKNSSSHCQRGKSPNSLKSKYRKEMSRSPSYKRGNRDEYSRSSSCNERKEKHRKEASRSPIVSNSTRRVSLESPSPCKINKDRKGSSKYLHKIEIGRHTSRSPSSNKTKHKHEHSKTALKKSEIKTRHSRSPNCRKENKKREYSSSSSSSSDSDDNSRDKKRKTSKRSCDRTKPKHKRKVSRSSSVSEDTEDEKAKPIKKKNKHHKRKDSSSDDTDSKLESKRSRKNDNDAAIKKKKFKKKQDSDSDSQERSAKYKKRKAKKVKKKRKSSSSSSSSSSS